MDTILLSDTHIDSRKEFRKIDSGINTRLSECLNILEQVHQIALNKGIKRIIHLGDLIEKKNYVSNEVEVSISRILNKIKNDGIEFILLLGNHDFDDYDFPLMETLHNSGVINLIMYLHTYENMVFLPYQSNIKIFEEDWIKAHKYYKFDYFFFHNELPKYNYATGKLESFDLPMKESVRYISGHLHDNKKFYIKEKQNSIEYMGSPYHVDFNDCGKRKFIYLLDSVNNKILKKELKYPKFVTIDRNLNTSDGVEGNYIKFRDTLLQEEYRIFDKKKVREKLMKQGAKDVTFDLSIKKQKRKEIKKINKKSIIEDYVNETESDLNKEKLIKIGRNLFHGGQE